jgi:hypothetical protein
LTKYDQRLRTLRRLISQTRATIAELHAANPPLPWPLRHGGKEFGRGIWKFLVDAGPEFADLVDRFEKLELTKLAIYEDSRSTDDGKEEVEKHAFDEIQVPSLRKAAHILVVAGRRLRAKQPNAHARTTTPKSPSASKQRGPTPRNHATIAAIAGKYEPWKTRLAEVCAALDSSAVGVFKVKDRDSSGPLERKPQPKNWVDALKVNRRGVSDAIEYSLKQAT